MMTPRIASGRSSATPLDTPLCRSRWTGFARLTWAFVPLALGGAGGCGRSSSGTCEESDTCAPSDDAPDGGAGAYGDATVDAPSRPDGAADDGRTILSDDASHPGSGDAGSIVAPSGDGGAGCLASQKTCGGSCVEVDDPTYGCAATGCAPCALENAVATCSAGACAVAQCDPGYAHCAGSAPGCETSITTTSACGGCTDSCTGGTVCAALDAGTLGCALECPTSAPTNCSGSCVDLTSDDQHCGQCGVACNQPPAGGTSTCESGKCVPSCPSTPSTEKLCGDTCVDTATSNADCGGCNLPCTAPAHAASAQCAASQCDVTCQSGYHLCDGACDPNTDLPDQDPCEITETFGVFVSATLGTDGPSSGTRAQPFKTIGAGLNAASTTGKRLYVCVDTYGEAVTLTDGIDLFGYFTCAGGAWAAGTGRATIQAPTTPAVTASNLSKGVRFDSFTVTSPAASGPGVSSYGVLVTTSVNLTFVNDAITAGAGAAGATGSTGGAGSGETTCTAAGDSVTGRAGGGGTPGASGSYGAVGFVSGAAGGTGGSGAAGDCGGAGAAGSSADCGSHCVAYKCCDPKQDPCESECCAESDPIVNQGGTGNPGTGGNGGLGGTGGSGGGASIALFASGASTVSVVGGSLTSGAGGVGGAGGSGGGGAKGANGAQGTAGPACGATAGPAGGAGGTAGGTGGAGGQGGGGAGGDSYAYYGYGGATITLSDGTTTAFATAAAGGAGGTSGPKGAAGAHD